MSEVDKYKEVAKFVCFQIPGALHQCYLDLEKNKKLLDECDPSGLEEFDINAHINKTIFFRVRERYGDKVSQVFFKLGEFSDNYEAAIFFEDVVIHAHFESTCVMVFNTTTVTVYKLESGQNVRGEN